MTPAEQIRAAEQLLQDRRLRDQVFGAEAEGFGEPAWDILLALFAGGSAVVSLDKLTAPLNVPAASVRTYADWLISRDLAIEEQGAFRITSKGRGRIAHFLSAREGNHAAEGEGS